MLISVHQAGNIVTFNNERMPTENLPEGEYTGRILPAEHPLGDNGSGLEWRYVEITDGPYTGRTVSVTRRKGH